MAKTKKLSIVIPCYNEKATIEKLLREIEQVNLGTTKKEIIIIDDCSKDGTPAIIKKLASKNKTIKLLFQPVNQGKGAALKRAISASTGDVLIVQDADLEYDPQDYKRLLYPLERDLADVVYGSRFKGGEPHRIIYYRNHVANKILTGLSNILSGMILSDMETCYKMFRGNFVRDLTKNLKSKRFGFDAEITARVAKSDARVCEVGISYYGRNKEEGKKIKTTDGIKNIWEIVYYNLTVKKK